MIQPSSGSNDGRAGHSAGRTRLWRSREPQAACIKHSTGVERIAGLASSTTCIALRMAQLEPQARRWSGRASRAVEQVFAGNQALGRLLAPRSSLL